MIKHIYNNFGHLELVYYNCGTLDNPMWATLPYNSKTKTFEPQSDLDKQLLAEAQSLPEWATLDLKDETPIATSLPEPNWVGLLNDLRATPVFGKVYVASKNNLSVNVAYTLLLSTLTATEPNINDLIFALHDLKANMPELETDDIEFINQVLAKYHFPIFL